MSACEREVLLSSYLYACKALSNIGGGWYKLVDKLIYKGRQALLSSFLQGLGGEEMVVCVGYGNRKTHSASSCNVDG